MKRKIIGSMAIIVFVALMLNILIPIYSYAVGYGSSLYGPQSVVKGEKVTISFGITDARNITGFQAIVNFDSSLVKYDSGSLSVPSGFQKDEVSSGNQVRIGGFGADAHNVTSIASLSFTATGSGNANFSVDSVVLSTVGGEAESPAGAKTTVSIAEPLPGNTRLSSLKVDQGSLSPAFSPDTQNYSLPVAMGVDRIVVSAQAEDSKASVSVSGNTGLKDGANTIRVVVTAQNGSTRTYTITANRQGPTPTPEPTPTPPLSVSVDGNSFNVVDLPEGVEIPAGFYEATIEINGQTVTAYKSRNNSFILLYLSNDGPESGFYFYNEESGEFLRFAQFSVPGAVYTRIIPDESVEIPAGFVEARITIDGEPYDCWKPYDAEGEDTDAGIYLLYLLNEQGEKGFYLFQNTTRLIFPYSDIPREPTPSPTPEPTPTPVPSPTPEPEIEYSQRENPYFIVTIILAAIIVILSGVLAWLLIRRKGTGYGPGPDDDNDGMGMDDNSSGANFIKPPKIRRVDAPSPDEDEEEF